MIGALTNHLWQSTLFAIAAGLLTLAVRSNGASVRHWLWLSASLKFLIPFSLLIGIGSHLEWAPAAQRAAAQIAGPSISLTVEQFGEPFAPAITPTHSRAGSIDWFSIGILAVWACGFLAIVWIRWRAWLRSRDALRASTPLTIPAVQVRLSRGLVEPGVVGLFHPILLLPEGILDRLTPPQIEAVLAHELCHVRRRDNLWASIHMMVEAVFWFHPLVWWIGARLVEERERACDEEVLRLGNQASVYADAILLVCKLYLESPLPCVSGVAGADIRRRIEAIMANRGVQALNRAKKTLLAGAGVVAIASPVAIGIIVSLSHVPPVRAQTPAAPATPKFDAASIKPCAPGDITARSGGRGGAGRINWTPGRLRAECQTVDQLIRQAYLRYPDGKPGPVAMDGVRDPAISDRLLAEPIKGSPSWAGSDRYTIEAEATGDSD